MIMTSIFDSAEALFDAAKKRMAAAALKAGDAPIAIIVPGGNTPKPLFEAIAADPFPAGAGLHIGYTDERLVPDDSPMSNYGASRVLLDALAIPHERILKVKTELPLEQAADEQHAAWKAFLERGGVLPLAFLGLGEDGHTCSLFTPEQVRDCPPDRFAAAVTRESGPNRVTLTPALLAQASHVVFLAVGPDKASVVNAMVEEVGAIAATQVAAHCARVSLWYAPEA